MPVLIEPERALYQTGALGAADGSAIAVRARQEPRPVLFHGVYQEENSRTAVLANELDDEDGIALQDLADDRDGTVHEATLLVIVAREPEQDARLGNDRGI